MAPWYDYQRRLSPLKLAVFITLFVPGLWVVAAFPMGWLGARPVNEAIHQIGLWMFRFLFIALAITPLRNILHWQRLALVRRMIGVAAFAYGVLHLTLYAGDQAFDLVKIATEIAVRIYLTIGFVALLGLATLAATSTDRMVRRLGQKRWQRLHWLVYPIAMLALTHYWMQSKLDVWEPTIFAGIFVWLMGYRVLARFVAVRGRIATGWVGALGIAAAALTALGEALYFYLAFGADPTRVLDANFSLVTGIRPAVIVLALGMAVTLAGFVRGWVPRPKGRPHYA